MTDLERALAHRDGILDTMSGLAEWAPQTSKWRSLNIYMINQGKFFSEKQEVEMPMRLRQAQEAVLKLLEE